MDVANHTDFADFTDLELLAEQPLDFDVEAILTEAADDYAHVPLHELFDLLEDAVESYTLVQPSLAVALQRSAEREIEFFMLLLQARLNVLLAPANRSRQLTTRLLQPQAI